jgi:hypothetical protein
VGPNGPTCYSIVNLPINSKLYFLKFCPDYFSGEQSNFHFQLSPDVRCKSGKTAREGKKKLLFRDGFGKLIVLGGLLFLFPMDRGNPDYCSIWRPKMKGRLVIVLALIILCVCLPFMNGCANNAQSGAAIGGAGGVVIGAIAGGGGGAIVGGLIGAGGGYVVGNEMDK